MGLKSGSLSFIFFANVFNQEFCITANIFLLCWASEYYKYTDEQHPLLSLRNFMQMEIKIVKDKEEMAAIASSIIGEAIKQKPNLLLCAATGNSPTETYQQLISRKADVDFSQLRIIKLDEWGGVPMTYPNTCEQYLQYHLIKPLGISSDRYFAFHSNAESPENEITKMQTILANNGPIDVCTLGLGLNGHIALNEPASHLLPDCHIATLSTKSMQHSMAIGMPVKPSYGLTMGMADIMKARLIVLLISGQNKKEIISRFLSKEITTQLPASFLWLHPNVKCFIHEQAI